MDHATHHKIVALILPQGWWLVFSPKQSLTCVVLECTILAVRSPFEIVRILRIRKRDRDRRFNETSRDDT